MQPVERWWSVAPWNRWPPPPWLREWLRAWWASTARPVPFVFAIVWVLAGIRGASLDFAPRSPQAAVAEAMTERGLGCTDSDVTFVDPPGGLAGALAGTTRALVRASAPGEPSDLYLVRTRLSPTGAVLDVGDAYDVTRTTGVDESVPAVRGTLAAYATSADGLYTGVHVLDLAGRPASAYGDFGRTQRFQIALANAQQTGQTRGIAHDAFALDPIAHRVSLAWRDDRTLQVQADEHLIVLDAVSTRVLQGDAFVRVVADERARPGNLVTWAVDRVRAMSWFGSDRMQWLKAVAFTVADQWRARFRAGRPPRTCRTSSASPLRRAPPRCSTTPRSAGRLRPSSQPCRRRCPARGNGSRSTRTRSSRPLQAKALRRSSRPSCGPTRNARDVRVYVTLWDPRQVALHMEAGNGRADQRRR